MPYCLGELDRLIVTYVLPGIRGQVGPMVGGRFKNFWFILLGFREGGFSQFLE